MSTDLDAWLKSGNYLPPLLRDFHDQKEVFKTMHELVKERPGSPIQRPSWIEGQCYVVDVFLWFMARRGWTLQRSRARLPFRDLEADVIATMNARAGADLAAMFRQPNDKGTPQEPSQAARPDDTKAV